MHLVATSTPDVALQGIEPARTHCTYDPRAAYSEALSTWTDVGPDTAPSAGVMDLRSLAILELSTYTPNGARENLYVAPSPAPLEPMGFTGKESDEELGMTYFGERWLIPRLGRWASPDPLHVHASGGGEALNGYHYVSGNLLQARDPLGLDVHTAGSMTPDQAISALATSPELAWARDQGYIRRTGDSSFAILPAERTPSSWTAQQREAYSMLVTASAADTWTIVAATQEMRGDSPDMMQSELVIDPTVPEALLPWRAQAEPGELLQDADRDPVRRVGDPRNIGAAQPVGETIPSPDQLYTIHRDLRGAYGPGLRSDRGLIVVATHTRRLDSRGVESMARVAQSGADVGDTIAHELAVHAALISLGNREYAHRRGEDPPDVRRLDGAAHSLFSPLSRPPSPRTPSAPGRRASRRQARSRR